MMILGIAVTAATVGAILDPYSPERLVGIVACVCVAAVTLTALAMWGIERGLTHLPQPAEGRAPFRAAMAEVWAEPRARAFAIFVFLSMTAYFMQELILEPFAGHVFGFTPGESTSMAGLQNGGVFLGMLTVGVAASGLRLGSLKLWTAGGCLGSAAALIGIAFAGLGAPQARRCCRWCSRLGFFNGVFAVAAIGSMMQLAGDGPRGPRRHAHGPVGRGAGDRRGLRRLRRRRVGRRDAPCRGHAPPRPMARCSWPRPRCSSSPPISPSGSWPGAIRNRSRGNEHDRL